MTNLKLTKKVAIEAAAELGKDTFFAECLHSKTVVEEKAKTYNLYIQVSMLTAGRSHAFRKAVDTAYWNAYQEHKDLFTDLAAEKAACDMVDRRMDRALANRPTFLR